MADKEYFVFDCDTGSFENNYEPMSLADASDLIMRSLKEGSMLEDLVLYEVKLVDFSLIMKID